MHDTYANRISDATIALASEHTTIAALKTAVRIQLTADGLPFSDYMDDSRTWLAKTYTRLIGQRISRISEAASAHIGSPSDIADALIATTMKNDEVEQLYLAYICLYFTARTDPETAKALQNVILDHDNALLNAYQGFFITPFDTETLNFLIVHIEAIANIKISNGQLLNEAISYSKNMIRSIINNNT